MLKPIIYRLGQDPKASLKRFLIGLGLFTISVAAIWYGYYQYHLLQLIGLLLLVPSLTMALWGYIGIFANRFSQVIATISPATSNDDNDNTK